jgi:septal ring factor EnvC (AmiA/AmiB activator)
MNDSTICQVFTEQLTSLKDLMNEKFNRLFENQENTDRRIEENYKVTNERMAERKQEIKALDERADKIEKDIVEIRTEKETSERNTRILVIVVGILLGALEVYLLFKK